MVLNKASYLLLTLLLLWSVSSRAQDRWENYFEAGMRARQEGNLPKAELLLKASRLKAEIEADAGNPRAPEMMIDSLSGVAVVLREEGKPVEAEHVLREQLDLLKSFHRGEDDLQTSMTLHNLGLVLFDQQKYEDAGKSLAKAVQLRKKYDPEPHRNLAISLLSLGGAYFHQGKIREAEAAALQAREILAKISADKKLPEDLAAIMRSDHNLALIYVEQKKYEAAEQCYKAAISAMERLYGPMSGGLVLYLTNYAKLLNILKRDSEVKAIQERIGSIEKQNE
jgi:tetratricopeptide (TPR) repeat protein